VLEVPASIKYLIMCWNFFKNSKRGIHQLVSPQIKLCSELHISNHLWRRFWKLVQQHYFIVSSTVCTFQDGC